MIGHCRWNDHRWSTNSPSIPLIAQYPPCSHRSSRDCVHLLVVKHADHPGVASLEFNNWRVEARGGQKPLAQLLNSLLRDWSHLAWLHESKPTPPRSWLRLLLDLDVAVVRHFVWLCGTGYSGEPRMNKHPFLSYRPSNAQSLNTTFLSFSSMS